jgi:DNA invertase Pin-like site-specific DNA recombinase
MPADARIPAAEYVRMSTDDQQYSISNQQVRIQEYAEKNGFVIVRTYKDPGRSGVALKHRDGLSTLLADVVTGKAEFKAILVYDVSRWGRFQNPDEAAHYEFLCSMAGVQLHYCAEEFSNDGTAYSALLKSLKRSMAAEFSRELGEKVLCGKRTLVELGYWVGGPPGFGYRRLMLSGGKPKQVLKPGEQKSLKSDRITLVLGPREEVEAVRMMYKMAADGHSYRAIGRELERRNIFLRGSHWNITTVQQILSNPKYIGTNVWYRHTQRLSRPQKPVEPKFWIQKQLAFPAIVDLVTYDGVQAEIKRRHDARWTAEKVMKKIRRLWKVKGRLSERIFLRNRAGMPCCNTIRKFFGNYQELYARLGYKLDPMRAFSVEQGKRSSLLRRTLCEKIKSKFPDNIEIVSSYRGNRLSLRIDNTFSVAILFCRRERVRGKYFWAAQPRPRERNAITLVCLLTRRNDRILHYYLIPKTGDWPFRVVRLNSPMLLNGTKISNLSEFYPIVKRLWQLRQQRMQPSVF